MSPKKDGKLSPAGNGAAYPTRRSFLAGLGAVVAAAGLSSCFTRQPDEPEGPDGVPARPDAGPDASPDAAGPMGVAPPEDAGPPDATEPDVPMMGEAPPEDAGPPDAGIDAGLDGDPPMEPDAS